MFPPYTLYPGAYAGAGLPQHPLELQGIHHGQSVYSPGPEDFHQDSPRYNSPKPGMYGEYFIDHPPGAGGNDQWSSAGGASLPSSFPSSHLPGQYPHPSHPHHQQQQQSSYADMVSSICIRSSSYCNSGGCEGGGTSGANAVVVAATVFLRRHGE
ncbi:transcription factor 4-like isoform X9 [Elysia marginata]|uniref:Transcription factor 4-like isoform X9 n=1 Tax=Elysia marginata TaxID=1093978 RepID=A0AAV4JYU1_9GAST|nr:transcription factor 4-like isoform X9 [Elysia marginata]